MFHCLCPVLNAWQLYTGVRLTGMGLHLKQNEPRFAKLTPRMILVPHAWIVALREGPHPANKTRVQTQKPTVTAISGKSLLQLLYSSGAQIAMTHEQFTQHQKIPLPPIASISRREEERIISPGSLTGSPLPLYSRMKQKATLNLHKRRNLCAIPVESSPVS